MLSATERLDEVRSMGVVVVVNDDGAHDGGHGLQSYIRRREVKPMTAAAIMCDVRSHDAGDGETRGCHG
ncbi:hypothetical protein Droror1_Dr00025655 [Drosera rotundifolia]